MMRVGFLVKLMTHKLPFIFLLTSIVVAIQPIAFAGINDGLVAYYPFNGNANDESGNGHNGAVDGASLCNDKDGNSNSAYCFDGVDDNINIGNDPAIRPGLPISFAAWVKKNSVKYQGVFRNDYYTYKYTGIIINFMDTGQLGFSFGDGGGTTITNRRTIITGINFGIDTWYHIACVMRGANDMDVYVNGIHEDTAYYDGTGGNLNYDGRDGIIGLHGTNTGGPIYFHGTMDEVRFYNRELTEFEIRELAGLETKSVPAANKIVIIATMCSLALLGRSINRRI